MKAKITGAAKTILKYLATGIAGCFLAAITILVVTLNGRPDLSVWHLAELDEEFTADSRVTTFAGYLELEERLFEQLDDEVYAEVEEGPANAVNRYSRGSMSDPGRWPINWNRSFEFRHDEPRAGVLLLHGLSDSPYSLRAIGERLHEEGATVVGLRIPGHGTAPSGLVDIRWQDMAAAVRLAARHVSSAAGDKSFYMIGYSNGGALAIEYALSTLTDDELPRVAGIVLLSPEIGLTGAAALAAWQRRLGSVLGLEKLAWNDLIPEYDPFKYGSFAVNAGDLAHRITVYIQKQLSSLQGGGKLSDLPPVLAFQSAADGTVTASALVSNLFDRLPPANHELVLFDINRRVDFSGLLKNDPRTVFEPLLKDRERDFELTVITNESEESNQVVAHSVESGSNTVSKSRYLGDWPDDVFSLSHVALPIPPSDPLYGGRPATDSPGIELGMLAPRGERGVLWISGNNAMRLRWNPFYDYVESRVLDFTGLVDE